ncbi:MAG: transposase [Rhodobacterales bacterium]
MDSVQAMRGVGFIVAVTVVAEVGDFQRFDNPRQLMAYLGLTPSEHSSGASVRQGGITKAGRHQRWSELRLEVNVKSGSIHYTADDPWCDQGLAGQACDECLCLPRPNGDAPAANGSARVRHLSTKTRLILPKGGVCTVGILRFTDLRAYRGEEVPIFLRRGAALPEP